MANDHVGSRGGEVGVGKTHIVSADHMGSIFTCKKCRCVDCEECLITAFCAGEITVLCDCERDDGTIVCACYGSIF